ncbi:MAG: hypothetical protein ACLFU4_04935 [Opitutales bacterium]
MDNILEILVPLAFAAIYFFGSMFTGKKEDGEQPPPLVPRDADSGEADEDAERQRRIQEEIRRKIMERRRSQSGESPAPPLPGERPRPREERVARAPEPVPQERRVAREQTAHESTFSGDHPDDAYDKSMDARLRQIEETKRRAERLKKQADKAHMKNEIGSGSGKSTKRRSGAHFSGPVRESLADPAAARVAFIYGEVLGRPVGLRDASSSRVPGLDR